MSHIPVSLLEVREHNEPNYKPLIDYQSWRVALINFAGELSPEKINRMQKHNGTDEVFVLLAGRCILFLGEGDNAVTKVHAVDMEFYKLYNVKRSVWHSHTLSKNAKVLIVENRDTADDNSPFMDLTTDQRRQMIDQTRQLWK
ncbi:MAG: hypothetical protein HYR93_02670 [Chloroflexi bacterium]|nr:hypothetical protein [Chloroflexota bacterium]